MSYLQAILLAIIEGITEFLPVSSTGHLIIGSSLMGIASQDFTKLFTVCIQLGAILSVVVLYWKRFIPLNGNWKNQILLYSKLVVAFIPAAICGLLFKKHIDALLENTLMVAVMLLVGGVLFLVLDNWFNNDAQRSDEVPNYPTAFKIGWFQTLAMIPGVSRSAASIIGGISQGLTRKAAAEFSFFLAIPTMFGATVKDLKDYYDAGMVLTNQEINLLVVGNLGAFVVALLAIKSFIGYLTKHGFKIFGYYRIAVGLLLIVLILLKIPLTIL